MAQRSEPECEHTHTHTHTEEILEKTRERIHTHNCCKECRIIVKKNAILMPWILGWLAIQVIQQFAECHTNAVDIGLVRVIQQFAENTKKIDINTVHPIKTSPEYKLMN